MAVGMVKITNWVEDLGLKYTMQDSPRERVVILYRDDDVTMGLFIGLKEDGDILEMEMNIYDENKDMIKFPQGHSRLHELHAFLLNRNYEMKFGCWEWDERDGEIKLTVTAVLEDAEMTKNQFLRMLSMPMQTAKDDAKAILKMHKGQGGI